jgi:hypothetical protein
MTGLFISVSKTDPDTLYARDIKPGMVVARGEKLLTVTAVSWMSGKEVRLLSGNGLPAAVAIKLEFAEHEPLLVHPSQIIEKKHQPQ